MQGYEFQISLVCHHICKRITGSKHQCNIASFVNRKQMQLHTLWD